LQNSSVEMTVKPRVHNSGLRMSTLQDSGAGPGTAVVRMAHNTMGKWWAWGGQVTYKNPKVNHYAQ